MTGDRTPPNGSVFEGNGGALRQLVPQSELRLLQLTPQSEALDHQHPKITGFAVASKKRNRDFHALFRSVPDDDYLIEDYSCALQREILAHGRLYVSEGHLCFSSNIFGWVTTLVMSFDEIISVEKRSTALLFKNGLMISTLHAKNVFASFTSRDSTYDLIRLVEADKTEKDDGMVLSRPGSVSQSSEDSEASGDVYDEDEDDEDVQAEGGKQSSPAAAADFPGPATHAATTCSDGDTHYAKILADETIPAPLGKVYSLMFGPASITWMRDWLSNEQKCLELNYDENAKVPLSLENKVRNYSYIKPLNGAIGPKQTKCISTETLDALDLEKAISVTVSTVTPDKAMELDYKSNCAIEWTGKSWLKNIIAALKAAVGTRRSGAPGAVGKGKKKGRKGSKANNLSKVTDGASEAKPEEVNWGLFEPRIAAYEEIWRREESELWLWLEERAGMERLREVGRMPVERLDVEDRLKSEGMEEREIEDAIRVTEERLLLLKDVVGEEERKESVTGARIGEEAF
ncbi:hypothetical protein EYC84_002367 [Monilinia fructicola]|uniref:VASt domain-containing protein n=1 Tax=Monilinia fructicola TaxID=38448 RepID=A0A5M9JMZ1_MONFR|nr:hypothetical protein EYC84_002367 [Monilinia fructicola]